MSDLLGGCPPANYPNIPPGTVIPGVPGVTLPCVTSGAPTPVSSAAGSCDPAIFIQQLPPPTPTTLPAQAIDLGNGETVQDAIDRAETELFFLNATALSAAPPCSWVTTQGGKLTPVSALDALKCLPWTAAGQIIRWDGTSAQCVTPAPDVDRLAALKDGPGFITPNSVLVGSADGLSWKWQQGQVVPPPPGPGLALLSQTGGMIWSAVPGVSKPFISNCGDFKKALRACVPVSTCQKNAKPDANLQVLGVDACGDAAFYPASILLNSAAPFGCADIGSCFTPDSATASPATIFGTGADGKIHAYPASRVGGDAGASPSDCVGIKAATPLQAAAVRPSEVMGADSAAACGRFVRTKSCYFRGEASSTPATKTQLSSAWASGVSNWLFNDMAQIENSGTAPGAWDQSTATYSIAEPGLYEITASGYFLLNFKDSGAGVVQPDSAYTMTAGILAAGRDWIIGQQILLIDKQYDPGNSFTLNGVNKALISPGMGYIWSGSFKGRFAAGDKIRGVGFRLGEVRGDGDATIQVTSKYNGTGHMTIYLVDGGNF